MQVHGLAFSYALHEIPPGRLPFRRWRWELWHGQHLLAAGWRIRREDAGRALRTRAHDAGRRILGLGDGGSPAGPHDIAPGSTVRVQVGPVVAPLVPRGAERATLALGVSAGG